MAREVGQLEVGGFADAIWWVDLRPPACGDRVAQSVDQACGLRLGDSDVTMLLPWVLAGQHCLLVLGNCEHLTAAVGALLPPGLDRALGVRLQVTSQVALHLTGEQV